MRLRKPLLAQILLFIGLLGAFGFARQYSTLYFYEFAGFCVLILFVWLAFSTKVKRGGSWIIYLPVLLITSLIVLYAYVFSIRTGAPIIPSILAQRERVFFLLAPVVYMLHMRGWRLADFQRTFVLAASLAIAYYAVAYFTIDAASWFNSGDFYKRSMVQFDEWRGFRLKGPLFLTILVALYFGRRAWQAGNFFSFASRAAVTMVPVVLLVITFSRSTLQAAILALILYGLLLWRTNQVNLSLILLLMLVPLGAVVGANVASLFTVTFAQDWSYLARVRETEIALELVSQYPLLGIGQPSYQSVSISDIAGPGFQPSDIGLLGVAVQFGIVGLLLYLFLGLWIFVNFLKLLMVYRGGIEPQQRAFLWVLFVIIFTYLIVSPVQAPFIYEFGVVAFTWGLLLAHKHGLPTGLCGNKVSIREDPLSQAPEQPTQSAVR